METMKISLTFFLVRL